jgi:hypothetical protein
VHLALTRADVALHAPVGETVPVPGRMACIGHLWVT